MYKNPGCSVSQEKDKVVAEPRNIKITANGHEITISIPTHWTQEMIDEFNRNIAETVLTVICNHQNQI